MEERFLATDNAEVAVFQAGPSLREQLAAWAARNGQPPVAHAMCRTAVGIRRELAARKVAIVDATHDPREAGEISMYLASRLGRDSVAVYTEEMHASIESFVRVRGSQLLFGPLTAQQWDGFLARALSLAGDEPTADVLPLRANSVPLPPAGGWAA